MITKDINVSCEDFRRAGAHTADLTANAKKLVSRYDQGEGLVETVFTDYVTFPTTRSFPEQDSACKRKNSGGNLEVISELKQGEGTAGLILADTTLRNILLRSAGNVEQGTDKFNENMEAMRSNFLFRGYFKEQEKEQKKKESGKK